MAIAQYSSIDYTDLQSVYTTFNTFISNFGGSITTLTIPSQNSKVEDTDINNLNTKINAFKSDTYLSTKSSWWVNASVTAGDIARASDWTGINTTMGNFSKVKCRNQGTYQNTNHSNTCSQGTRNVSCSYTNRNHNCSNGPKSVSCSYSDRNHNCSNGPNSVSCNNTLKSNKCSDGLNSHNCSQGTRTVQELANTPLRGLFIGLCAQTFSVSMRYCFPQRTGCSYNNTYQNKSITFSLSKSSSYSYTLTNASKVQDIIRNPTFQTLPFSATCSHSSRTVTETVTMSGHNQSISIQRLNIPVYVTSSTYQLNSQLVSVQTPTSTSLQLQSRDSSAATELHGINSSPFYSSATCAYGANTVSCSHTTRSVSCNHQYHGNTCSQGTRGVTCNPNGKHSNTCSQGTRDVTCNPNGKHTHNCSDGPNSVTCSYTVKGHETFIDITCIHKTKNGK